MGFSQQGQLEWVPMFSSRVYPQSRDGTHVSCVSCISGGFFTAEEPVEPLWGPGRCQTLASFAELVSKLGMFLQKPVPLLSTLEGDNNTT